MLVPIWLTLNAAAIEAYNLKKIKPILRESRKAQPLLMSILRLQSGLVAWFNLEQYSWGVPMRPRT